MNSPSYAFLVLDSSVTLYADIIRYLTWELSQKGVPTIQIGCDEALTTCTSINSSGIKTLESNEEKKGICNRCIERQNNNFAKKIINIKPYESIDIDSYIENTKQKLIQSRSLREVIDYTYEGLPVCRIAFFDYSILTKSNLDTDLSDELIDRFSRGLKDILLLKKRLEEVFQQTKITQLLYINGNYSQNTIARLIAKKFDIKPVSIEPQLTSQESFCNISFFDERLELNPNALFSNSLAKYASKRAYKSFLSNFGARIDGADFNAYTTLENTVSASESWERFSQFAAKYTTVNTFFMSSEDELIPHKVTHGLQGFVDGSNLYPYQNQVEFTQYLINQALKHPDIGFVIRMHPRMAVNKRNNFESEEHKRYKSLLSKIKVPDNVLILTGDSKLSSYYVIQKSSLIIVAWSTIGIEAALIGKKVVSAFPNYLMYPLSEISKQPQSIGELEAAVGGKQQFGQIDESKMILWCANAYEEQFVPVFARRGSNGLLQKVAAGIQLLSKPKAVFSFFAPIFSVFYGRRGSILDKLLKKKVLVSSQKLGTEVELISPLENYRTAVAKKMIQYEQSFKNLK